MLNLFNEFENIFNFTFETEIETSENGTEIRIPVPGFKKSEIQISVEENILTVSGKAEKESTFKRSFTKYYKLPQTIDQEKIQARQEDGVLSISLKPDKALLPKRMIAIS